MTAGCGSSDPLVVATTEPATPSGAACTSAHDCNPDQCVCTDGEAISGPSVCAQGTCASLSSGDTLCTKVCADHGGVTAIRPTPNVATSAECDAWCSKGAALACGSAACDRFFFCSVPKHSCEAAARAALKCNAEKGTWACSTHSSSWSVSSSCPSFLELCAGADAGTK